LNQESKSAFLDGTPAFQKVGFQKVGFHKLSAKSSVQKLSLATQPGMPGKLQYRYLAGAGSPSGRSG
jgi:hypothetical protein